MRILNTVEIKMNWITESRYIYLYISLRLILLLGSVFNYESKNQGYY